MPICDVCGNEDVNAIVVTQGQRSMTFDNFECAIEAMAPRCARCGSPVIGRGVAQDDQTFCGADCAGQSGEPGMDDRAA
jgi:hypothetical protein